MVSSAITAREMSVSEVAMFGDASESENSDDGGMWPSAEHTKRMSHSQSTQPECYGRHGRQGPMVGGGGASESEDSVTWTFPEASPVQESQRLKSQPSQPRQPPPPDPRAPSALVQQHDPEGNVVTVTTTTTTTVVITRSRSPRARSPRPRRITAVASKTETTTKIHEK